MDLAVEAACLSVSATNFSLRDRLTFWDENAFRPYPRESGLMGWMSTVTVSYAEWERDLVIQQLSFGENCIVIGGHTFLR